MRYIVIDDTKTNQRDMNGNRTEDIIGETNGLIRKLRLQPPLHYVWKIESYSTLLESKWKKIESGNFEVDGRKWKLTFYPNGNHNHKGKDYISPYLSISDVEELPLSWDLSVKFKFLVFDQINGKYLVVEDGNEMCRFQRMKTEWGFAQLLSLDVFKEPTNGYLFDDCCVLGVDVSVVKGSTTRGETFSVINPTGATSYSFKIENFSTIDKEFVSSEVFTIKDLKWKLVFYPKGTSNGKDDVSALFLRLQSNLPDFNSKVYVKYKLRLIDQVYGKHYEVTLDYSFHDTKGYGMAKFVPLVDVKNAAKGYLVKDTIILEVEIDYLSVVKHFS